MMIKNTKSFIEFCKDIGIVDIIGKEPSMKFIEKEGIVNYPPKNKDFRKKKEVLKKSKSIGKEEKLEGLRLRIKNLSCNLKDTATNLVYCDGNVNAKVMVIGGVPGTEEDRVGIPFVGEAGKLLYDMLFHVGLSKLNCYFSNLIFWRPPGNRLPNPEEIETCLPYTKDHIEIIQPEIIILVGGLAAKNLLNITDSITKMRGKNFIYSHKSLKIKTFVIFQPEFLIKNSVQKKRMWLDLTEIKKEIRKIDNG